jgi:hypothetical protein
MQEDDAIDCRRFDEAAWLLVSGELDDAARSAWQRHVAGCDGCAGLLAARRRVLDVYDATLPLPQAARDVSRLAVPARRGPSWRPAAVVAAALLLLAVGALAGRATARSGGDGAALRDIRGRLSEIEVQLAVARVHRPSAAERLQATAAGVALVDRDPRIIESLLDALEADPSPNVRIAVVDALYQVESTTRVQERFDTLLAAQAWPVLRIALIELAADRRFVEALGSLRRLAIDPSDEAVRARAEWAVGVLTRGA